MSLIILRSYSFGIRSHLSLGGAMTSVMVESYRKPTTVNKPSSREVKSTAVELHDHNKKLAEAGFTRLTKTMQNIERLTSAGTLYDELKGSDLKAWIRFLPTHESIGDFAFSDVPPDALQMIIDAQSMNTFDRIEVWSPQGNSAPRQASDFIRAIREEVGSRLRSVMARFLTDPMAVGVVIQNGTEHFFPIVRWGESLKSIASIKRATSATTFKSILLVALPISLSLGLVVLGVIGGIMGVLSVLGPFGWLAIVFGIVVIVIVTAMITEWTING